MKNMKMILGAFFVMGFACGAISFGSSSHGESAIDSTRVVNANPTVSTQGIQLDPSVEPQYAKFRADHGLSDTTDTLTLFLLNNLQKRVDEVNNKLDVVGPRLGIEWDKGRIVVPTIRI